MGVGQLLHILIIEYLQLWQKDDIEGLWDGVRTDFCMNWTEKISRTGWISDREFVVRTPAIDIVRNLQLKQIFP